MKVNSPMQIKVAAVVPIVPKVSNLLVNRVVDSTRIKLAYNVSICVRAGLPKPRPVPDTERTKDTTTLDYASTPLDANTLLVAVWHSPHFIRSCVFRSLVRLKNLFFCSIFSFFKYLKSNFSPRFICRFNIVYSRRHFFH
jgi:hypothetical protein